MVLQCKKKSYRFDGCCGLVVHYITNFMTNRITSTNNYLSIVVRVSFIIVKIRI